MPSHASQSSRRCAKAPSLASQPQPLLEGWLTLHEAGGVTVVCKPNTNEANWPGWNRRHTWKKETLASVAEKHPFSNLGVNCGASGLTVVDIDSPDPELLRYVLEEFGDTPLIIRTPSGGWHLYYRNTGQRLLNFRYHANRAWQKPIEIRGRGAQVVAPPSVRPGGAYTFLRSPGWVNFSDLPPFPAGHPALATFRSIPITRNIRTLHTAPPRDSRIGEGERHFAVQSHVLRVLAPLNGRASLDVIQARAQSAGRRFVEEFVDTEDGHPFTDDDLLKAIQGPIEWTASGTNFCGMPSGTNGRRQSDIAALKGDGYAFLLLEILRDIHPPGTTFALAAKAMADAQVVPSWGVKRYRAAIGKLLRVRLNRTHTGRGKGDPHLYEWLRETSAGQEREP